MVPHIASPNLEYDASWAIFGNEMVMPVARGILELGFDEFIPAHIGRRSSDIQGAMSRLVKLGYITPIEGSKPKRYQFTRGPFEELVAIFNSALIEVAASRTYEFIPLEPPLASFGNSGFGWQRMIDKTGARLLCDGASRIAALMQIYDYPYDVFYTGYYGWTSKYYSQMINVGMMETLKPRTEREWYYEHRLPSPLWQIVPVIWQHLLDNYPHPAACVTYHVATLHPREPSISASEMSHPGEAERMKNRMLTFSLDHTDHK